MDRDGKASVLRNLTLITQLSLYVMVPVFMCLGIGVFIDSRFGLSTTLPMLIIGIISGGRTGYVAVKNIIQADEARRRKKQDEDIERKVKKYGKN